MKKYIYILTIILIGILSSNCEKVISLELPDGSIFDVIEANVYDSVFFVTIKKSSNNYFTGKEESIKNAKITLDVDGTIFHLDNKNYSENNRNITGYEEKDRIIYGNTFNTLNYAGYKIIDKRIFNGKKYKLRVEIGDNIYTAEETGFYPPNYKSVNATEETTFIGDRYITNVEMVNYPDNFEALIYFVSLGINVNNINYGSYMYYGFSSLKIPFITLSFFPSSDANSIEIPKESQKDMFINMYVSYTSNNIYKYKQAVEDIIESSSNTSSPENPITNIKIEKSNKDEVLGFFAVYNFTKIYQTNIVKKE